MAVRGAKAVFVGNIKGGVGKSTLTVYLTEYLRQRFKRQGILLIDTDPQGTAFELLEPRSRAGEARFLPVGDRYDAVNMTTLDGVLRRFLSQDNGIAMVDSGAGKMGNFWQVGFLCNALLVPTSMSWTDLRPTLDFIKEIDERKEDQQSATPHIIVVPNRVSPNQRHFDLLPSALKEVNAILAPPISELSVARNYDNSFDGLEGVKGLPLLHEIVRLGEFIVEYVISGELDKIYARNAD